MHTAVYSPNTLCPLISVMSYYCNGYCRGCIRLPEAMRGHAQLITAVKESRMLKVVCPLSAMALLWLIHSCYYIIHETENGVPKLWACAGG